MPDKIEFEACLESALDYLFFARALVEGGLTEEQIDMAIEKLKIEIMKFEAVRKG